VALPLDEVARRFPQLEIKALVGQGGMGVVYRARQPRLDRDVALKLLPPEQTSDPSFAERFLREARAMARLAHPNIVAVHDFGESDGLCWLLMDFVDGVNLREALRAGGLPPEKALAVVPQLCNALQYAHDEGVVHRDIKPENVLLDRQGRVKIADFGLAKLGGPQDVTLTGERQVFGTPHYMAPEQMESACDVDHRADIYSLGVVAYELFTGRVPFEGHTVVEILVKHTKAEPEPPRKLAPSLPQQLEELLLSLLAKSPDKRPQTCDELADTLETIALA
jgi:serine/threonine protein kinase